METKQATSIFELLSSSTRLDIFRLLVKHAPAGLIAGDIASSLDVPSTNLSFHLKGLLRGGLVSVTKEGRFWRYRAAIPLMLDMVAYLTAECCSNDPELCQSYRKACGLSPYLFPKRCGIKTEN